MIAQALHATIIACSSPSTLAAFWVLFRAGPVSPSTVHMMNMLAWDLTFVLISTPNTFGSQQWSLEHFSCRLYRLVSELVARMSANALAALAVSEYLSHARDAHLRARAQCSYLVVMSLWLLTVLQSLAAVPRSRLTKTDCLQLHEPDPDIQWYATVVDFTCSCVLPIAFMLLFVFLLIKKPSARGNLSKDLSFIIEPSVTPIAQTGYRGLVIALVVLFIACNAPFYGHMVIMFLYEMIENFSLPFEESYVGLLIPFGFWCKYFLSVINPILVICVVSVSRNGCCRCTTSCFRTSERSKRISNIPILS